MCLTYIAQINLPELSALMISERTKPYGIPFKHIQLSQHLTNWLEGDNY